MKKIFVGLMLIVAVVIVIWVLFPAIASTKDLQGDNIYKILIISDNDSLNVVGYDLFELMKADGQSVAIGHLLLDDCLTKENVTDTGKQIRGAYSKIDEGGRKFETANTGLKQVLQDDSWDYVSIQYGSTSSLSEKVCSKTVCGLVDYLKENIGEAKLILEQYSMAAVSNVRTVYDSLCVGDKHFQSGIERYAAACAWFEVLTAKNSEGNPYVFAGLESKYQKAAQKAAHIAVICPDRVIQQVYLENPQGGANYDEQCVPDYVLPDPLTMTDGTPVTSMEQWNEKRRPELLHLFETEMYGKAPAHPQHLHFKVLTKDKKALNGLATRKEVAIYFTRDETHYAILLMYVPNNRQGAVPLFFGLNFKGNHTISTDPGISYPTPEKQKEFNWTELPPRGWIAHRWPIEWLMEKGYALATIYNGDIDPDFDDNYQNGVHSLAYKPGQTQPEKDEWGTIASWAWAMSCTMDYFETDKDIDSDKVAVFGHSRNGKAALWAGATDQRFSLIISNESGCGGAALSRRCYGERIRTINSQFTHWFCRNFWKYNDKEHTLPFDQHELIALLAPRPVYIASALGDQWADPKGEFLSGVHASPVYELFGLDGLTVTEMPAIEQAVQDGMIGYHIRSGKHEVMQYDWEQYVKFADKRLK